MSTATAFGTSPEQWKAGVNGCHGHDLVIHAFQHVFQMTKHQGTVLDDTDFHTQPADVSSNQV